MSTESLSSKKSRFRASKPGPDSDFDPDYFWPSKGKRKHVNFATWDIESKDGDSQKPGFTRPFMVGLYDGKRYQPCFDLTRGGHWGSRYWRAGGCVDQFMMTALQPAYDGWWFGAHNAGAFDSLFLLPWLRYNRLALGLKVEMLLAGGSLLAIDVRQGRRKWRFVDTLKLLPMTVDAAAETFGVTRKYCNDDGSPILDRDGNNFGLNAHEDDPGWLPYNRRDCVVLHDVMHKSRRLVEEVFGGELGMTAPSTAIKTFRRSFMQEPIHRGRIAHALVRYSYAGGRTEPLATEGRGLGYFDINSSYVASMRELMPVGAPMVWRGRPPARFTAGSGHVGFVEALVHVPDCDIPPLPIRADSRYLPEKAAATHDKLIFPVGYLRGVWEWGELQHAIECGAEVIEWHASVWFEAKPILRGFMEKLYRFRDKSHCHECGEKLGADFPEGFDPFHCSACNRAGYDQGLDHWAKLLGNSTYGRFAMNPVRQKLWWQDDDHRPYAALPFCADDPDSPLWYSEEEEDDVTIIPQISARITALSRVLLHKAALEATSRTLVVCSSCVSRATYDRDGIYQGGTGRYGDPELLGLHGGTPVGFGGKDRCGCGASAHRRRGRVYYMDTDSIMTDVVMPTSDELGALKDEIPRLSGHMAGRFLAAKLYRLSVDDSYRQLPREARLVMLMRDKKYLKKLKVSAEKAVEDVALIAGWDQVKAKGISRKLRTKENFELLFEGAMARLEWASDPKNICPRTGRLAQMPDEVKTAGTLKDQRLEKFLGLARLVKVDERGRPVRVDGHKVGDAFGRGPRIVSVTKRLHLRGAKRDVALDGSSRPWRVDMREAPQCEAAAELLSKALASKSRPEFEVEA